MNDCGYDDLGFSRRDMLSPFMENSSTKGALFDFAQKRIKSFNELSKQCWPEECKQIIKTKLRKMGLKRARTVIRSFCTRQDWDWKKCDSCGRNF